METMFVGNYRTMEHGQNGKKLDTSFTVAHGRR